MANFFGDKTGNHQVVWFKGFLVGLLLGIIIHFIVKSGLIAIPFL